MKKIHLIAGYNSFGALCYVYENNGEKHQIFGLRDYLCIGPLYDINNDQSIYNRKKYFKSFCSLINDKESEQYIDEEINYDKIKELKTTENPIYYYCSNSSNEQIYLRFLCYFLENANIYIINLNKIDKYKNIKATAEIELEDYPLLLNYAKKLTREEKNKLKDEYLELQNTTNCFRLFKNNKILVKEESFLDDLILEQLTSNFTKFQIILCNVFRNISFDISDSFLSYRIMNLIKSKKIIANNIHLSINDIVIKKG